MNFVCDLYFYVGLMTGGILAILDRIIDWIRYKRYEKELV